MPRRYRRSGVAMFERAAVAVRDFPSGQGPPLYLSVSFAECTALGPGQGALVPFDGTGGAVCHGLHQSRAVVLVRSGVELDGGATGAAYCLHATPGPLDPAPLSRALDRLGRPPPDADDLFVVVASRGEVTERDERVLVSLGLSPDHVFTYSNCHLPHFGVSGKGRVGEAR